MSTARQSRSANSPTREWHAYPAMKRVIDILVSGAALVGLAPLFVVLGAAIRIHSPGPAIYRQTRVGKDGELFTMLKFRSMRSDADSALHKKHVAALIRNHDVAPPEGVSAKIASDPRITGLGRLLRKLSVDELPQLYNVLTGEMSLVGPRPPLPYEVELYEDWHMARLRVRPGVTGLWQVSGRNRVSFDDMVRMDIEYIETMSLWTDLKILAATPAAALMGDGAH